jgi:hypothetical protein
LKTSWIIGIMSLWVVCYILCSVIEESNLFTSAQTSTVQGFMQPTGTDITTIDNMSSIGQAISLITNVWSYIKPFIQAVFLYFPDLWNGAWLWFYYIVIMPISVAMIVSIVFIFRGVHSA